MTLTPLNCPHCSGHLIIIDNAVNTTVCESCSCIWELRSVPMFFGPNCDVKPETYPQESDQEVRTVEERLRGL